MNTPDPMDNRHFREMSEMLPETWANLPTGEDDREMENVVATHIRAAYGLGYVRALEEAAGS